MISDTNPFHVSSTVDGATTGWHAKTLVLSAFSTLVPFVLCIVLERSFGLLSGGSIVLLFGVCIFCTTVSCWFVHRSFVPKFLWWALMMSLYLAEVIIFGVLSILIFGIEAT